MAPTKNGTSPTAVAVPQNVAFSSTISRGGSISPRSVHPDNSFFKAYTRARAVGKRMVFAKPRFRTATPSSPSITANAIIAELTLIEKKVDWTECNDREG
jgi:hypothetical protein